MTKISGPWLWSGSGTASWVATEIGAIDARCHWKRLSWRGYWGGTRRMSSWYFRFAFHLRRWPLQSASHRSWRQKAFQTASRALNRTRIKSIIEIHIWRKCWCTSEVEIWRQFPLSVTTYKIRPNWLTLLDLLIAVIILSLRVLIRRLGWVALDTGGFFKGLCHLVFILLSCLHKYSLLLLK